MARRAVAINLGLGAAVAALCLLPLWAVARAAVGPGALSAADWQAIRFTIWQAFLSAVFSVGLAIPVARALARRSFPGRGLLISLLGAPFLLPVLVAVLGILTIFGRGGLLNSGLAALGLPPFSIYGLHGVVLAHVFFNLPLAVRLILQGWQSIPAERVRLARSLRAPQFRVLEWPMLREVVPGALVLIFLVCLTSFAVAITLGGGPRATTLELAIYQAVLFDFDLARAARLALVQYGLCAVAAGVAGLIARPASFGAGLGRSIALGGGSRLFDGVAIGLMAVFLLLPLGAVLVRGAMGLSSLPATVWASALVSVTVALGAVAMVLLIAVPMALLGGRIGRGLALAVPLASSSLVLGAGAFLLLRGLVRPQDAALGVTMVANTLMALPFALRILSPAADQARAEYDRLAAALRLPILARLWIVYLPRMRRQIGFAAGLTAAMAMGDLGAIVFFAAEGQATLPLLMQRLLGAYRTEAAAGVGLVLVILSFGLFWLFDQWGRGNAAT
ncbi:thiamine/thiamine pyrophosphate ABC transporter permease ThiP [Ketogulonicigenium vulgare]|uniref:thiamine/thiamine pyrophosphate ABC transporter permease ThiP n=1 Tax=Ketogulonicigenium vulgare TaxID=92945 RepID=UPI0001E67A00|nr:thiamine/thiamine pyrophosphate ABC transporter permease ThiP [Ketogulonicigenium vulgare]ADO43904.1 binding-protein-dependent transport systems inner membrane component [Ketogulonicigenium vulgare Y25]ALJ79783.1 ABC transporter permease [Ketogulonicigenium vulgare]ANW32703.1 thiamine/thiamine pyrophosphate ABC transporter permease ThiP [Ketogulonicigenium vulgare]